MTDAQKIHELEEALQSTNTWLETLVNTLGLDPADTHLTVSAVNKDSGTKRTLKEVSLAERIEQNKILLKKTS